MSFHKRLLVLVFLLAGLALIRAADTSPHPLLTPAVAGWEKLIGPNGPNQPDVSFSTGPDGVAVSIKENGTSGFPGIHVQPATPWDLSAFGRVDATVTNTGEKPMRLSMRVDDANGETGVATVALKPGDSQTLQIYLGYASQKAPLKASAISGILIFTGKAAAAQSFRVGQIVADGPGGEKPPLDPKTVVTKPAGGVIWNPGTAIDPARQIVATGGAQAAITADQSALQVDFKRGDAESISLRPEMGTWNLNDFFQLRMKFKNNGSSPVTPMVRLDSKDGPSDVVSADAPIAPGQSADLVVPFAAKTPWEGDDTPEMSMPELKKNFYEKPGTGTKFASHRVIDVAVLSDPSPGATSLLITSIAAENPPAANLPAWLGQKPPVDGEWTKTFEDNFDGAAIDLTKWNIYAPNFWDTRTHFSKDNVMIKDGTLTLRVEKKTGRQNDDPAGKETDYATGYADTYGKWVQRYGYFEARVKLPKAPCLWPAFWLMPDRGLGSGDQGHRQSTKNGGMEFDIVEQLSTWGPERFNLALHWDGYGKMHKSIGNEHNYVQADKDGFIVVGLLWTPGALVLYGNGQEIASWNNARISTVPSAILLDNVTGGWETEPLDDAQLPGDFVIDYVRVWQRKDLASPGDGPKPNAGTPAAPAK
jgi:beta-glucanase (GH16 family)